MAVQGVFVNATETRQLVAGDVVGGPERDRRPGDLGERLTIEGGADPEDGVAQRDAGGEVVSPGPVVKAGVPLSLWVGPRASEAAPTENVLVRRIGVSSEPISPIWMSPADLPKPLITSTTSRKNNCGRNCGRVM